MSSDHKPWLILEGDSDASFFRTRKIVKSPKLIVAIGWENVVEIVQATRNENISNYVFGVIDRDYREALGEQHEFNYVVNTDFRDLEIMLLYSKAYERVVCELGSTYKLPHINETEINFTETRDCIIEISTTLGRFRFYCQQVKSGVSFAEIDHSKFIDYRTLILDPQALINHLNGKNIGVENLTIESWHASQNNQMPESINSDKFINHGHDTMTILGLALRRMWGTVSSKDSCRENIEKLFRIGFSDEEFQLTELYTNLTNHLSAATG